MLAQVQAYLRKRLLRSFVARGHLESHDAKDMVTSAHGCGFLVDAGVRIEAAVLPNWDMTSQPAPDYPDAQRTAW